MNTMKINIIIYLTLYLHKHQWTETSDVRHQHCGRCAIVSPHFTTVQHISHFNICMDSVSS